MPSQDERLQMLRAMWEKAQQEFSRLHLEVKELTSAENEIRKRQSEAVYRRNHMQNISAALGLVVHDMERKPSQEGD